MVNKKKASDLQIKKEQIKVPIWFKEDANPKYICYCNQVTEENIVNAVKNEGARNMKDITEILRQYFINHPQSIDKYTFLQNSAFTHWVKEKCSKMC